LSRKHTWRAARDSGLQRALSREDVLLGNLGVTRPVLAVLFVIPAIVGEIAILVAANMIA